MGRAMVQWFHLLFNPRKIIIKIVLKVYHAHSTVSREWSVHAGITNKRIRSENIKYKKIIDY